MTQHTHTHNYKQGLLTVREISIPHSHEYHRKKRKTANASSLFIAITVCTFEVKSLQTPCGNMLNANYFTKIRAIIKNACYFVCSTDLNKIFNIKYMYK